MCISEREGKCLQWPSLQVNALKETRRGNLSDRKNSFYFQSLCQWELTLIFLFAQFLSWQNPFSLFIFYSYKLCIISLVGLRPEDLRRSTEEGADSSTNTRLILHDGFLWVCSFAFLLSTTFDLLLSAAFSLSFLLALPTEKEKEYFQNGVGIRKRKGVFPKWCWYTCSSDFWKSVIPWSYSHFLTADIFTPQYEFWGANSMEQSKDRLIPLLSVHCRF